MRARSASSIALCFALLGCSGGSSPDGGGGVPTDGSADLAVPKLGYLYVADKASNDVLVLAYYADGATAQVQRLAADGAPWSLALDPVAYRLVVGNQNGVVSSYGIDATSGKLSAQGTYQVPLPLQGTELSAIALHPSGRFVYAASYEQITPLALCTDGTLSPRGGLPFPKNASPWSMAIDPSGTFAFVPVNVGATSNGGPTCGDPSCYWHDIYLVDIDPLSGALTLRARQVAHVGTATLLLDPAAKSAYGTWGSQTSGFFHSPVDVYAFDAAAHTLTSSGPAGGTKVPDDVTVGDGKSFAFVHALDGVSSFAISPTTGALSGPLSTQPSSGNGAIAVDEAAHLVFSAAPAGLQVFSFDDAGMMIHLMRDAPLGNAPMAMAILPTGAPPTGDDGGCPITGPPDLAMCGPALETNYPTGGAGPTAIVAGDWNRDGKPDLAVAHKTSGTVTVMLSANGGLQAGATYTMPAPAVALTSGDWNGDGKLDLAVAAKGVEVLLGNGDGTFQAPLPYNTGGGPSAVTAGDFNGDGKPDLAVVNSTSYTVSILLGVGDGTFLGATNYMAGVMPLAVAAGDFDGNGKLDLAVVNQAGAQILVNKGSAVFQAGAVYATDAGPSAIVAGDFDGNGKLDLAVANAGGGDVSILLNGGNGAFQAPIAIAGLGGPTAIQTADWNGDGKLDLAVTDGGAGVNVLFGMGGGTFAPPNGAQTGTKPASLAAADFDLDGKLDLAVANTGDNDVSVLKNNGCVP